MNEGIVERGEDTGNAEDELAYKHTMLVPAQTQRFRENFQILTITGQRAESDVLLGGSGSFLGRHFVVLWWNGIWEGEEKTKRACKRSKIQKNDGVCPTGSLGARDWSSLNVSGPKRVAA